MSHLNPLENKLRSWTPRDPSPALRKRLFKQPLPEASLFGAGSVATWNALPRWFQPDTWHWLAPAMAVFVLGMFVFGQSRGGLHQFDGSSHLTAAAAWELPGMAPYYASVRHSENNTLRSTFEWTNDSRSLTTSPPMTPTNSVIQ